MDKDKERVKNIREENLKITKNIYGELHVNTAAAMLKLGFAVCLLLIIIEVQLIR
jgi:hypothetical protein